MFMPFDLELVMLSLHQRACNMITVAYFWIK